MRERRAQLLPRNVALLRRLARAREHGAGSPRVLDLPAPHCIQLAEAGRDRGQREEDARCAGVVRERGECARRRKRGERVQFMGEGGDELEGVEQERYAEELVARGSA